MKLPWDKRYLKISFHVVFTAAVIILLWLIMKDFSRTGRGICLFFGSILRVVAPLIWGAFIAFIHDPAVEFFQNFSGNGFALKLSFFHQSYPFGEFPACFFFPLFKIYKINFKF